MNRDFYLELAGKGARTPIGTDLVLHEKPDHEVIRHDGRRLADVVAESAARYHSPLAIPVMDLTLEKEALLTSLGVPAHGIHTWHVKGKAVGNPAPVLGPKMKATCDALTHLAGRKGLVPVGMGIGPFSFMTKLMDDPITPVFLAGTGATADEEEEVATLETCLAWAEKTILMYLGAQIEAGAQAIILCEPAANTVYFSPKQMEEDDTVWKKYVLEVNLRIKAFLDDKGVDLIFHDCGELTESMVASFRPLDPVMLSLGSSRKLWEDAAHVSKKTVLYGNMPSKHFYSDQQAPVEKVTALATELMRNMKKTGHPFILGSECDVLHVEGCGHTIRAKVDAFMKAPE